MLLRSKSVNGFNKLGLAVMLFTLLIMLDKRVMVKRKRRLSPSHLKNIPYGLYSWHAQISNSKLFRIFRLRINVCFLLL